MSYEGFAALDGVAGVISYFFSTLKKKNKEVGVKWKRSAASAASAAQNR